MYYFLFAIFFMLLLCIIIPIKIVIDYEFYSKDYDINDEDVKKEIKLYVLRIIKVKTFKSVKKEKEGHEESTKFKNLYNFVSMYKKIKKFKEEENVLDKKQAHKLKNNIKIRQMDFDIGYNVRNVMLNCYLMSFLNYEINSIIAKNEDMFDMKHINYTTYISNNLLRIKLNSIVDLNIANTIGIIINLILKYKKGGEK